MDGTLLAQGVLITIQRVCLNMILSRTSQYAIQVMIYLATRPRGEPVLNRNIARHLNVPAAYLVKVLQLLAKGKLVHSSRGRRGGYCLCDGMEKIDLMQILLLTEKEEFSRESPPRSSEIVESLWPQSLKKLKIY